MIILNKSYLAAMTAVILSVAVAGCSGTNGGKEGNALTTSKATNGKYDPPITITTARVLDPNVKFKPGETIEDNVHSRWMSDKMGINMKHTFVVNNEKDFNTKLRLLLAGSEPLPDVFQVSDPTLISELIQSGKVMALDDAIAKFAPQNIKDLYQKYPDGFNMFINNGKTYGIPMYESLTGGTILWVRQDWLKKLNLPDPKTIDDMDKVLEAFTNQDPDGNNKKDTFGLALSMLDRVNGTRATADWVFGAYGNYMPFQWSKDKDGNLVYGSIQPSIKEALSKLRDWMSKGYIDPEAGIKDKNKATESFVNGSAGLVAGEYHMYPVPLLDTVKNNAKAEFKPLYLPAGPTGNIGRVETPMVKRGILFSKDFQHVDAWFAYYKKLFEYQFFVKDSEFYLGNHEGYDYVMKDGKPVYQQFEQAGIPKEQWPLPDGKTPIEAKAYASLIGGTNLNRPYSYDEGILKFANDPKAVPANPIEDSIKDRVPVHQLAGKIRIEQNKYDLPNEFKGSPTKTMRTKLELLEKMEKETFNQIIYGKLPVDAFDKYVADWKASGGDEITKEVNEWYKSLKK
ncbi:extracellular solute-binding protein [Paenibacillus radicis (ex Xue et al. 2023)]|uniref:Extracellular solute-binding protein n=1 Tax=Paenibacillus radicis (ex Xue et al. 2023) TaxID=2972489 RepID=A0ABT1YTG8_9BACL|nr:extracellular solute-binding protein [Paenibacillus radicis (ex Xue et al. 2023)]MCR8635280.1 extracellular solute-binding protein [Paenibacillus radicis (ex Xue et al. 2023)]